MCTKVNKSLLNYPVSDGMPVMIDHYVEAIHTALDTRIPLHICGSGTKRFYGNAVHDGSKVLDMTGYHGIVDYEPTELVMTARAGTPLVELESVLKQHGQMLAFEPPYFGPTATLGGCVAAGLSGPRRAASGAVRDFVLGVRMLDGKGRDLSFGGRVMKNVAGYDVARLMVGSLGTLGILLEISVKVLPRPIHEVTLKMAMDDVTAIKRMNEWAGKPLPISATCHVGDELFVRLSGAESAIRAAWQTLGGDEEQDGDAFWRSIRDHTHDFFQSAYPMWRLSIQSTMPPVRLPGKQMIEWNGGLRWLVSDSAENVSMIRVAAEHAHGHATLFRSGGASAPAFHPLASNMMKIHHSLKEKFDPERILNPGRLYSDL